MITAIGGKTNEGKQIDMNIRERLEEKEELSSSRPSLRRAEIVVEDPKMSLNAIYDPRFNMTGIGSPTASPSGD